MARPLKPFTISTGALRTQGVLFCIIAAIVASVLPVLSYIFALNENYRGKIDMYVHWGVVGVACIVGLLALVLRSSFLLGLHVVLGAMLGAAIAAYDASVFDNQDFRLGESFFSDAAKPRPQSMLKLFTETKLKLFTLCKLGQAAFSGCSGACTCAAAGTCTGGDLASAACSGCQSPSLEFCQDWYSNRIIIGAISAVTVFALALPCVFSLLVLLRCEAERGVEGTKVEWVAARVQEQTALLEAKQPLTLSLDALRGSIQRLEATKSDQMIIIAERAKLALLNAGYTEGVSPDTIKAHQLALSNGPGNESTAPLMAWQGGRTENFEQRQYETPKRGVTPPQTMPVRVSTATPPPPAGPPPMAPAGTATPSRVHLAVDAAPLGTHSPSVARQGANEAVLAAAAATLGGAEAADPAADLPTIPSSMDTSSGLLLEEKKKKKKHHSKDTTEGADLEAAEEGASTRHRKKKDKSKPDAAEGL